MPAHLSLAEQEREWRRTELGLAAISEKGRTKMCDTARKQRDSRSDVRPTALEQKRKACAPPNIKSAQININKRNGNNTESNALKVDERLRLARERREVYQKQLALRERGWLAREERAKQFYEKHLEERRKKLEEQRQREERRRMAVEEKRKQRLKEERERYESVVRKTMEKSEKAKQKPTRCSRRVIKNENNNAKRRSLSQWEIDLVRRLQTPTVSYLARSRSAVCLSRDTVVHVCRRSASCHTMNSSATRKPQVHCGKVPNRPASSSPRVTIRRTTNRDLVAKGNSEGLDLKKPQIQTTTTEIKPKQDTNPPENTVLPASWLQNRSHIRQATIKQDSLPPLPEEEDLESEETLAQQCLRDNQLQSNPVTNGPSNPPAGSQIPNGPSQLGDAAQVRPAAWTTDPEEATRLLTEKRRQARLQREKEEEERRQKEEMERKSREELVRRRAEERARQEAEALRLEEEKRKREEEERLKAEEESIRRQKEEENRLQQQREQEARQRELAEQQRLERESRFQKEEVERQERKKRLEEIMKRTRKTDSDNKKTASVKDNLPCENVKPVIRLAGPGKTPKLELRDEEDMLPTVAFKERRSFRSLSGLDEIQAHQQTEVI
ncbi:ensconsin isoform X1 [Puntigrus tetrazona]|uniref:ensconsin isoform X1 n=1 Tax=Puntigrus tetrazona TaxID=1606681 RepID=UPI001C898167|nr:ensconsin isoform X1 [Puntigrus tetrazona]XP_043119333.1 ensconsin isoform X1 [Puntigrus tetrazona]